MRFATIQVGRVKSAISSTRNSAKALSTFSKSVCLSLFISSLSVPCSALLFPRIHRLRPLSPILVFACRDVASHRTALFSLGTSPPGRIIQQQPTPFGIEQESYRQRDYPVIVQTTANWTSPWSGNCYGTKHTVKVRAVWFQAVSSLI